jgi:hypothetical protein
VHGEAGQVIAVSVNSIAAIGIRMVNERLEFVPLQEQENFIDQFTGAVVYDVVGHTG